MPIEQLIRELVASKWGSRPGTHMWPGNSMWRPAAIGPVMGGMAALALTPAVIAVLVVWNAPTASPVAPIGRLDGRERPSVAARLPETEQAGEQSFELPARTVKTRRYTQAGEVEELQEERATFAERWGAMRPPTGSFLDEASLQSYAQGVPHGVPLPVARPEGNQRNQRNQPESPGNSPGNSDNIAPAPKRFVNNAKTRDVCERHGMHKVFADKWRWRCRR